MANNRMYLLHRPSGAHLYLGKRMASGWYDAPRQFDIEDFYDKTEAHALGAHSGLDDFALVMEHADGAPRAQECDWDISDERNPKLVIKENPTP
jgi:hypothetical protein